MSGENLWFIKNQPLINHATGIVFSGNQEHWYDGMSKKIPPFFKKWNQNNFLRN
jgi:hypothetical protein